MSIKCIIGDERSGVLALATASEGGGEFYSVGEIFDKSESSLFSQFLIRHNITSLQIRDGAVAFGIYRNFFQMVVENWNSNHYTSNGFLFTIKYQTYLGSPGLEHYLCTAGVKHLHIRRESALSALTALCLAKGIRSEADFEFPEYADLPFEAERIFCQRAYFESLGALRGWTTMITEDVFSEGAIVAPRVLEEWGAFFGLKRTRPLVPTTRPSSFNILDRAKLARALSMRFPFLDQSGDSLRSNLS